MSNQPESLSAADYFGVPGLIHLYKVEDFKDHNREVVGYNGAYIFKGSIVKRSPKNSTFKPYPIEMIRFANVKTQFSLMKVILGLVFLVFGLGWIILYTEGKVEVIFYWIAILSALGGLISLLFPFEHRAKFVLQDSDEVLTSRNMSWKSKRKLAQFMKEKGLLA